MSCMTIGLVVHRSWSVSVVVAGSVRLLGPERPFLEPGAAPVVTDVDDPQVAVLLVRRIPVVHLGPDHRRPAVDGQDAGGQGEDLVGAFPLLVPHSFDGWQADDGLLVGGLQIAGVTGKQVSEGLGAWCPPSGLIPG